jgi:membrane-associated phospholipid phosphatase
MRFMQRGFTRLPDTTQVSDAPPATAAGVPGARPLLSVCGLALALSVVSIASGLDIVVARFVEDLPEGPHRFARLVSQLGDSAWYLIGGIAVWLLARFVLRRRRLAADALLFLAVIVGPGIAVQLPKLAIGRTRPGELIDHGVSAFEPFSGNGAMPSGHATVAGAIAIFVICLAPRWWPLAAALLVTVGAARVLSGFHYPADVLAGWVFGILGGYLVIRVSTARGWWPPPAPGG